MNTLKILICSLLAISGFEMCAMNKQLSARSKAKQAAIESYQNKLAQMQSDMFAQDASSSDSGSFREMLTPRDCDNQTYERCAAAITQDNQEEFFQIVAEIGMGDAVLSDASFAKLIALADAQGKKIYSDICTDGRAILNDVYASVAYSY